MDRRKFLSAIPAAVLLSQEAGVAFAQSLTSPVSRGKKGIMLFNRIGPKSSELYLCNADGSNERKFLQASVFDYHASHMPQGRGVLFTSERNGLGNADVFRCRPDGTGIEPLLTGASIEDAAVMSPDGTKVAFVSSRHGYFANVWVYDLRSKRYSNVTAAASAASDESLPHGFFRPSWSPDSKWLAFSSDRNTDWRGHGNGTGWEHTQELSIYVARIDGTGFRRLASKPGYCLGSPRWSPDGKRVAYYEITTEGTWDARRPEGVAGVISQIVSVDLNGGDRIEHTSGPGLKVFPQFISPTEIAYHRKGGADEGVRYTSARAGFNRVLRSPTWSPDGKTVIYEKVAFRPEWKPFAPLYSWDPDWDYRFIDVFPTMARDGTIAFSEQAAAGSITIMNPDGTGRKRVYDAPAQAHKLAAFGHSQGIGFLGAYYPAWSPDSQWLAFGVGQWFQQRRHGKAVIVRIRRDGSDLEALTDGTEHSGFPSYSADGKEVVFRVWGETYAGLRILNLDTRKIRTLTTEYDNLPCWSPDGQRISFTRRVDYVNFDIFTIRPDGSDLMRLTTNRGNDGHAVWTADGKKIMWDSGYYGWREEATLYDNTFQPYGQVWIMNADGSDKRMLTDSLWEDSTPLYVPNSLLRKA